MWRNQSNGMLHLNSCSVSPLINNTYSKYLLSWHRQKLAHLYLEVLERLKLADLLIFDSINSIDSFDLNCRNSIRLISNAIRSKLNFWATKSSLTVVIVIKMKITSRHIGSSPMGQLVAGLAQIWHFENTKQHKLSRCKVVWNVWPPFYPFHHIHAW